METASVRAIECWQIPEPVSQKANSQERSVGKPPPADRLMGTNEALRLMPGRSARGASPVAICLSIDRFEGRSSKRQAGGHIDRLHSGRLGSKVILTQSYSPPPGTCKRCDNGGNPRIRPPQEQVHPAAAVWVI